MDTTKSYYMNQLKEQISFLKDACHSYDQGNFSQSKMMSAIIRTILKDPDNPRPHSRTKSLLTHLEKKDSLKLYNTGFEAKHTKLNIDLVGIVSVPNKLPTPTQQYDTIYLPILDYSEQIDVKWLRFKDWWESKIIVSETTSFPSIFTRKRIVLTMAEQDGGSHVDSHTDVDKEYLELATAVKRYFTHVNIKGDVVSIENLHFAIVRQIAHELLISLATEFNLNTKYTPTNKFNLKGMPNREIKQPGNMLVEGKIIESTRTEQPLKYPKSEVIITPPNAAYMKISF